MEAVIEEFLNGFAERSPFIDGLIIFFGEYYIFAIIAIMIALAGISFMRRGRIFSAGSSGLVSGAVSLVPAAVIKFMTHRPRPFLVMHLKQLLDDSSYAFPSGHTVFLAALATAAFYEDRRLGAFLFVSALLVGTARVAAGIHWPSDVIGGLVLGIGTGAAMRTACSFYHERTPSDPLRHPNRRF